MKKPHDLRYERAERSIKDAFWRLASASSIEEMAVKQILAEAEVSRSTFYNHYSDKYALLDDVENDLIEEFLELSQSAPADLAVKHDAPYVRSHCESLVQFVTDNAVKFSALLGEKGDPNFLGKLIVADQDLWTNRGLNGRTAIPREYAVSGIAGMVASLIAEWSKSGYAMPADSFKQVMETMLTAIVSSESLYK